MTKISEILIYAFIPVFSILFGGILGHLKKTSGSFNSAVLHFAAGVVFSVAAVEILPDIIKEHSPIEVAIGFSLGVLAMFLVKYIADKLEEKVGNATELNVLPIGLLFAMGIDLLIDGLLLGVGFAAGNKEGILLSMALALEIFSLGLAVTIICKEKAINVRKNFSILLGLGLTFFIGALIGITLLSGLSKEWLELVLSFGLAALLFLVTEELLTEAHEEKETLLQTSMFFIGFLLFLIIGMIS